MSGRPRPVGVGVVPEVVRRTHPWLMGSRVVLCGCVGFGCLPARVCVGGGMLSGSGAVRPGCGLRGLCLFWSVEGCGLWWVGWL